MEKEFLGKVKNTPPLHSTTENQQSVDKELSKKARTIIISPGSQLQF